VEGVFPAHFPRVPGHEVIGKIEAVGLACRAGKKDSERAWVIWEGHCGIANTVAVATSSIARINPFRVFHSDGGYAENDDSPSERARGYS